jgi:RNA polymerase sigma-70 factor (ECF subfamily)
LTKTKCNTDGPRDEGDIMDARCHGGAGPQPAPEENLSTHPLSAEQVFRAYAPRVYHTARRMVRSDDDAEDVTQDVLLQVVRKLPSFRGDSAFPTWLHRVTVNTALSHRRKQAACEADRVRDPFGGVLQEATAFGPGRRPLGPDAQLLLNEWRRQIDRAVAALPDGYRRVFVLADVEGRPNQAVADRLGLSLAAVKSRLHRARLLLRDALAPYFEEVAAGCRA